MKKGPHLSRADVRLIRCDPFKAINSRERTTSGPLRRKTPPGMPEKAQK